MNTFFTGIMNASFATAAGIHTLFVVGSAAQERKDGNGTNELGICKSQNSKFRHRYNKERGLKKIVSEAKGVFIVAGLYAAWSKILTKNMTAATPKKMAIEMAAASAFTLLYATNRAIAADEVLHQKIEKI